MAHRIRLNLSSEEPNSVAYKQFEQLKEQTTTVQLYLFAHVAASFRTMIRAEMSQPKTPNYFQSPRPPITADQYKKIDEAISFVATAYPALLRWAAAKIGETIQYRDALFDGNHAKMLRLTRECFECDDGSSVVADKNLKKLYASLECFNLSADVISEFVVPQAIAAQAKGFIKEGDRIFPHLAGVMKNFRQSLSANVLNKWTLGEEPRNAEEVAKFLQRAVFSSAAPVDDVVVVANTITSKVNYFFAEQGVEKKFGEFTVTIESVSYQESKKSQTQGLSKSTKKLIAGRYIQFNLRVENAQHEQRKLCVHFFKTTGDHLVCLDLAYDRTQFYKKLANATLQRKVVAQGKAADQLMLLILFAEQWKSFSADSTPVQIAEKYLHFYCALRQCWPDLDVNKAQFAAIVDKYAALLSPSLRNLQLSLVSSTASLPGDVVVSTCSFTEMKISSTVSTASSEELQSSNVLYSPNQKQMHVLFKSPTVSVTAEDIMPHAGSSRAPTLSASGRIENH